MSIYQHYRKYEHPFVDQVLSWKEQVERTYRYYLTDFLDPREQQIVKSVIGSTNDEIKYHFFGGQDESERSRAIIAPFYEEVTDDTFELILFQATFPEQFMTIKHQDIMGTFLSLGLERKKLGDIVIGDGVFQFITTKDIKFYVMQNLTRVKRATISLSNVSISRMLQPNDKWVQSSQTVSSLRLDNIIKEMYRLSRKRAVEHIERQHVKVNFEYIDEPSFEVIEGDIISVRGFGRGKLISIDGQTRKQRWRILTAILKS